MSKADQDNSTYFKLGAAVATGELWHLGYLGEGEQREGDIRGFLESFGINSAQDLKDLGMRGTYLCDFRELLPGAAD